MYKSLIISNIAETYYRVYQKSEPKKAKLLTEYDFLEADRGLFYANHPKVCITSVPVDPQFLGDVKNILGYERLTNLFPQKPSERICRDIINDRLLFEEIEKIIRQNPGIAIIPYYATPEFFELITILKHRKLSFVTPETISPKNRFIRDHYNSKVGFRQLWDKATDEHSFVKIPKGFVVDDLDEALDAAWWFYQNQTDFVFKYSRGTSGFGVVFYHCHNLPREEKAFKRYLTKKHQAKMWFEESFVIEEFINLDRSFYGGSPSIEFKINEDVQHEYNCLQRLRSEDNYFEGIIISKEAEQLLTFDLNRVVKNCLEFGSALADLDYKGIFDIDLVVDKKHNVYAVESNLRRTGGTHIFETAIHLFGRNFIDKIVVASRDNLPVNKNLQTYADFKKAAHHLYFGQEKGEGIIPTITSFLPTGKVGLMTFGKTLEKVEKIEKELISLVS